MSKYSALYFHLPFCESRCAYCDFYSIGNETKLTGQEIRFTAALRKECELRAPDVSPAGLRTIFFGGGTPTTLDPERLSWALEPLGIVGKRLSLLEEWTSEANPSSIDQKKIEGLVRIGVNRISMGVQSLDDRVLKSLGRVHDGRAVFRALAAVFEAGLQNVSVDFLCGVPCQTLETLLENLRRILSQPLTHVSVYLLTLKKGHPLYAQLPSEEVQLAELLAVQAELIAQGFEQYETSNFSRAPEFRAKHNLLYWKARESYLGFGPSAHSYDATKQKRWRNSSSEPSYSKALLKESIVPVENEEIITEEQREIEKCMLGLRLTEGVPESWFQGKKHHQLNRFIDKNLLFLRGPAGDQRVSLTAGGIYLLDQVVSEIVCSE
ncbi:MAG: radical SAM family heme chaperone HemW [Bdellovibrionota bacterium]